MSNPTPEQRRNLMIETIARQLCNDESVFDGVLHWTLDSVQECVDNDPDLPRLVRMLMTASTDFQKGRAAEAYQLLFRQNAQKLAADIVDDVMMVEEINSCAWDFDAAFDRVFKVQGL